MTTSCLRDDAVTGVSTGSSYPTEKAEFQESNNFSILCHVYQLLQFLKLQIGGQLNASSPNVLITCGSDNIIDIQQVSQISWAALLQQCGLLAILL